MTTHVIVLVFFVRLPGRGKVAAPKKKAVACQTYVCISEEKDRPLILHPIPSHHHREPHRTANHKDHLFTPSSRHGRLCGLQVRAAGRRSRSPDARCPRGRVCGNSARTDDSDGRDDGLAAVGEGARVHDCAGRGRRCLAAWWAGVSS